MNEIKWQRSHNDWPEPNLALEYKAFCVLVLIIMLSLTQAGPSTWPFQSTQPWLPLAMEPFIHSATPVPQSIICSFQSNKNQIF